MNEIENMYRKMLSGGTFDDNQVIHNASDLYKINQFDDDCETFIDSEDIAKEEEQKLVGGASKTNPEIEETLIPSHYKRYNKPRVHKYTEQEMEQIRKDCEATIVHDYSINDEYHMSDKEREEHDSLKELAVELATLKSTYRQVNQYIRAMRIVIKAWELLERKENYLHDKDEFFRMVGEGKIYSNRIIMPKFVNMKKYDYDTIIKYISNPELNPDNLMPAEWQRRQLEDDWYTEDEETELDEMETILSPEEAQYIVDHADSQEKVYVEPIKNKYIKNYDQSGSRKYKKLGKKERFSIESTHTLLNQIQTTQRSDGSYGRYNLFATSMFEPEEKEDDIFDKMRYTGSWRDKYGVEIYEMALNEAMMEQRIPGTYSTNGDHMLNEFFKIMEGKGMNVQHLRQVMNQSSDPAEREAENMKKDQKEFKKLESSVLQRITKLNNSPKFKKLIERTEKKASEGLSEE